MEFLSVFLAENCNFAPLKQAVSVLNLNFYIMNPNRYLFVNSDIAWNIFHVWGPDHK